jgi:hypothetical protein
MRARLIALVAMASLPMVACDTTQLAFGDANSIIVGTTEDLWEAVQDSLYSALETSITTTVETEEIFQVTFMSPADSAWSRLREFKQLLLVGTASDPWMQEPLSDLDSPLGPGEFTEVFDVWARGQTVTVAVLPEGRSPESVFELLPALRERYLERYRTWALTRMYVSGRDTALADTLAMEAGFTLDLPTVYDWGREGSVFMFRNDNPDPSELIRQFAVAWTELEEESPSDEVLIAWRDGLANELYDPRQISVLDLMVARDLEVGGHPARRIQAVWRNPPEADWPAGGNFIVQSVRCPEQDRLYLLDAWLYAPGRDKFEYLVQLETILDSFRCGVSAMP